MATKKTSSKQDDFYLRLRERINAWAASSKIKPAYKDYLLALPDLLHLLTRLMLDKRVDAVAKALLGIAIAYVLSPLDLIPDIFGPIGFVDDLVIAALALENVLKSASPRVLREHWAGSGDVIEIIETVLAKADQWLGKSMYRKVVQFVRDHSPVGGKGASKARAAKSASAKSASASEGQPAPAARRRVTRKATPVRPARRAAKKKSSAARSETARATGAAASRAAASPATRAPRARRKTT